MLFVTPPGFYKTTVFDEKNVIFSRITSNHKLSYLNCSDINKKYFNVGTPIVYYIICYETYDKKTTIQNEFEQFDIDVSKYNFIPRIVDITSYSILEKLTSNGVRLNIIRDDKSKIKMDSYLTLSTMNHLSNKGYWNLEIGTTTNRKRIVIPTKYPEELFKLLNNKLYRFILYAYRHDGAIYQNFLKGFRIPESLNEDPYSYFNITDVEKEYIQKLIND
jgi:hypothetical protein